MKFNSRYWSVSRVLMIFIKIAMVGQYNFIEIQHPEVKNK